MARAVQVRYINTTTDGSVSVGFTEGSTPLPAGQSGEQTWPSLAVLQAEIKDLTNALPTQQLLLLHLAITWLQSNGGFGNVYQVLNKQLQFDTTAANVIKIV
jgi:hypothetical protein